MKTEKLAMFFFGRHHPMCSSQMKLFFRLSFHLGLKEFTGR